MSYYNESEVDFEERASIREERSIERAQMKRENPVYCQGQEAGFEKCKMQCDLCSDIQTALEK